MRTNIPSSSRSARMALTSMAASSLLTLSPTVFAEDSEEPITAEDRLHWAFQSPSRPDLPRAKGDAASTNPIDHFIQVGLTGADLSFAPEADRHTLLRRLSVDLTGLPPTPKEIDAFLQDTAPGAYERLVDRLLASPAHGERWAQHWLDLPRFAESDGFEHDHVRKEAWRYRDWVIDAFNNDLPYDRFLQWQLAGDELAPDQEAARIATGFLMAGPDMTDINLASERRHEFLNKMTGTVGETFLGLTLGCAQCHTHKTDPISIEDFYRFRAIFANTVVEPKKSKQLPSFVKEPGPIPPKSFVLHRGDFRQPDKPVQPAFLRIVNPALDRIPPPSDSDSSSRRRSALAQWITRPEHPLTSRVMVNRLWLHHFGRGLVTTPNDFGHTGTPPDNQALLDWLATELPRQGWSLKAMHRLMVTSRTYRQASHGEGAVWKHNISRDPDNTLFSRFTRRRLDGEAIRDAFLSAAGLLNRQAGGPGIRPPLPAEVTSTLLKNQWKVTADASQHDRRSIYIFVRRNLRYPMFEAFDRPDTNVSCPQRNQSTTATQSLTMLNSAFTLRIASTLAKRAEPAGGPDQQVARTYLLLFGRVPSDREQEIATNLLKDSSLPDLCLALLNTNAAIYID